MGTPATAKPPDRGCTCFRLRSLSRRVTQHYDGHLSAAGLRVTQFSLLSMLIGAAEGVTVSRLAELMQMDRTTLTRNLRPLQGSGLVQLGPGKDARSRAVRLTDAGRVAWNTAKPYWRQAQNSLNAALGISQVQALNGMLDDSLLRLGAGMG